MKFSPQTFRIISLLLLFVVSFVTQSAPASAFGENEDFYMRNNIYLYDKSAVRCKSGTASKTTKNENIVKISKSETTDAIFKFLTTTNISTNNNKPLTDAQAAGVMGNMYAESGFNPASIEQTSREQKGHGLVQWTFGRWSGPNGLEQFATSKGTDWTNVNTQLQFLQKEFESTEKAIFSDSEFINTTEPAVAAIRFRVVFERADVNLARDDRREGAAISIFSIYGGISNKASCTKSSGIVSGNLVKTALYFALDAPVENGKASKSDAKITYQNEKAKYNEKGDWSDCGAFTATIMIASGVDKDYVKLLTTSQREYILASPEKYKVNYNASLTDLKPGDILFAWGTNPDGSTWGHTTMYTGEATYPSVDASLGERVPSVRNSFSAKWMLDQTNNMVATFIGQVDGAPAVGDGAGAGAKAQ
ncbi:MAG: phage tail tip lysozyme [Candidatus Microsaccharimonas sp.]